jgi:hypothetical protein
LRFLIDFAALLKLAATNGVSPFLYHNLRRDKGIREIIPQNVIDQMEKAFLRTIADNTKKTRETLLEMGYEKSSDSVERDMLRSCYHITFEDGRNILELHWKLAFRYFNVPPELWWEEIGALECGGRELRTLSTERYLLYTFFRLYTHVFRHLRFFVLPAEIIGKYQEIIDWHKLLAFSERYRMNRLVFFTLKLLHDLFDVNIPAEIRKAKVHGYNFLKRFVLSGLFDETERRYARILLYTVLQDTPFDTLKIVAGRLFPDMSEIRVRYGVSADSNMAYLYYFLNPLLLLIKKRNDSP